jgi:serine/threonine-protein kinase
MPQGIDDSTTDSPWWSLFDQGERKPRRRRIRLPRPLVIGMACCVCAAVTVAVWSARSGATHPSPAVPTVAAGGGTQAAAAAPDPATEQRLRQHLPSGYRAEACSPRPRATGSATLTCGPGAGPGAPTSATFALLPDRSALQAALDDVVAGLAVQDCPGRIQSPGPWRALGSAEPRGVLVCGVSDGEPVIAWTDQTALTLNLVRSDRGGPTIDDLFRWWGSQA